MREKSGVIMRIEIPENVEYIIDTLTKAGFEAYAVGGCVRDTILGRTPGDWDITTSAKPQEVKQLFQRTIDTGIEHGTVTIMMKKTGYEVTTYRIDGEYEDNRHPKSVEFTSNLVEDLKRRDFTINAMAYNPTTGLVDEFDGIKDLENKVIRCVGCAEDRFDEDALRILRAVRFAAQLGFTIEEKTTKAITAKASHLTSISAERIRVELVKLLTSSNPDMLLTASELGITKVILPEFDTMLKTPQTNPHHIYNVGVHTMESVKAMRQLVLQGDYPKEALEIDQRDYTVLCLTMLLHDIGKPQCRTIDETGRDHFHGHPSVSAQMAREILRRLKFDNYTTNLVTRLVASHDERTTPKPVRVRRAANTIGTDIMEMLFLVQKADISAQNPTTFAEKYERVEKVSEVYHECLKNGDPMSQKELAINGKDLIEQGFEPGQSLGALLTKLLEDVLVEPKHNTKEQLLAIAQKNRDNISI